MRNTMGQHLGKTADMYVFTNISSIEFLISLAFIAHIHPIKSPEQPVWFTARLRSDFLSSVESSGDNSLAKLPASLRSGVM